MRNTVEAVAEAEETAAVGEAVACRWPVLWLASEATGAGRAPPASSFFSFSSFLMGVLSALAAAPALLAALLADGFMDMRTGSASFPARMSRHVTSHRVTEREQSRGRAHRRATLRR